jgi:hypothetical protein
MYIVIVTPTAIYGTSFTRVPSPSPHPLRLRSGGNFWLYCWDKELFTLYLTFTLTTLKTLPLSFLFVLHHGLTPKSIIEKYRLRRLFTSYLCRDTARLWRVQSTLHPLCHASTDSLSVSPQLPLPHHSTSISWLLSAPF